MADQQLATYIHYGTDAERLAFTPSPPGAPFQPIYIWYATDTGATWVYDTSWHAVTGGGGVLPATVQGDMLYASAANTLSALAKDANATRYIANTGSSNNPAWAQVNLANGVTGTLPVANGGTGLTDAAQIRLATTVLTNAQILALPTTSIELIAAQGAATRIVPMWVDLYLNASGGDYTNISTNNAYLYCKFGAATDWFGYLVNDTDAPALTNLTDFLAGSGTLGTARLVTLFQNQGPYSSGALDHSWGVPLVYPVAASAQVNANFNIFAQNAAGDFTGGHADNTLTVRVYYTVVAVP